MKYRIGQLIKLLLFVTINSLQAACINNTYYHNLVQLIQSHDNRSQKLLTEDAITIMLSGQRHGFNPNCLDINGENLLMIAMTYDKPYIADLLLRLKDQRGIFPAQVNNELTMERNALTIAIEKNYWDIAKILITRGIRITQETIEVIQNEVNPKYKNWIIRKILKNNNPFIEQTESTLFFETVKHAYQQYMEKNISLLASILGLEYNALPETTIVRARSYFKPEFLALIMFDLNNRMQKKLKQATITYQPGSSQLLGLQYALPRSYRLSESYPISSPYDKVNAMS